MIYSFSHFKHVSSTKHNVQFPPHFTHRDKTNRYPSLHSVHPVFVLFSGLQLVKVSKCWQTGGSVSIIK